MTLTGSVRRLTTSYEAMIDGLMTGFWAVLGLSWDIRKGYC
jgi:hypothetical protein